MTYINETDFLHIPHPAAGQVSSAAEEAFRSRIPDWALERLIKALTNEDGDGTIGDGFAVTDAGGLDVSVAAGQGWVGGIAIEKTAPVAVADLTDDDINYIYLKTTATADRDKACTVEVSLDGGGMADAILIASVACAAGDITDVNNTPTGRAPYVRDNPNPQIINDIPGLLVVAPSGGNYTDPKTAIEAAAAGDTVYICAGTYTLTATITIPNNSITVIGANRDACILDNITGSNQNLINLNGMNSTRLRGFTIKANAANTGHAIVGSGCPDTVLEDLKINATGIGLGIYLYGSSHRSRVQSCYLIGSFAQGAAFVDSEDCSILFCLIETTRSNGIAINLDNSPRGIIKGNTIKSTTNAPASLIYCRGNAARTIGNSIDIAVPGAGTYGLCIIAPAASFIGIAVHNNRFVSDGDVGVGIAIATTNPYNLDETILSGNHVINFAIGIQIIDARVRETLIHGNKVATCTTGVSDAGTNTNQQDQD